MEHNDILREGLLIQWMSYGLTYEEVLKLIEEKRITSKNVFSDFLHWYLDDKVMFAEYIDLKSNEYQYIQYRKEIDWRD